MENFDIFIVCAHKDINKLPYVFDAIQKNIKGYEQLWLCTPNYSPLIKKMNMFFPINFTTDREVLKINPTLWKYRRGWIYQQMLKLFQQKTKNNYYFVCDADTIINKPLPLWEENHPIHYYGWDQNHKPYYDFNKIILGYERVIYHTCLSDTGFYSKKLVAEMLKNLGYNIDSFIKKTYQVINNKCYPSEPDLYFNWVVKHYPDLYKLKQLKTKLYAKEHTNPMSMAWSDKEIKENIQKMSLTDFDTFSIHSWCLTSNY